MSKIDTEGMPGYNYYSVNKAYIKVREGCEDIIPVKAHEEDAGYDLKASEDMMIEPGKPTLVKAGFSMALPVGFEAQVRSRSGMTLKNNVTVHNAPGTIDEKYRGEVGVILFNHGTIPYGVKRGDRIAQMVVCQLPSVGLEVTEHLPDSDRGTGGFGSTGK